MSVRLNPNARKAGRPQHDRKARSAEERQDRVRFNAAQQSGRATGVISMKEPMDSLGAEQPRPHSALIRLAGLGVWFDKFAAKKPEFKLQRKSILNADALYLLPPRLLSACLKAPPLSNKHENAIAVTN